MEYAIFTYIQNSLIQTILFPIVFMVFLRGFLGLYQDYKQGKKDGKIYFAWFVVKNKAEKKSINVEESAK